MPKLGLIPAWRGGGEVNKQTSIKPKDSLPVLANQVVHQVLHLVRLATRHNVLLQMLEVFGL